MAWGQQDRRPGPIRLPAARRSLLEAIEPIIGARASGICRVEASRGDCQGGAHTPIYQRTRFRVPSSWCTNPSALASPSDGDAKELPFSGDTS